MLTKKKLIARKLRNTAWRKSSYIHAKNRLKQRYGIDLDIKMYQKMLEDIKKDKGNLTIEKHPGKRILKYLLNGQNIYIVYSETLGAIKTFLPPAAYFNNIFLTDEQISLVNQDKLNFIFEATQNNQQWKKHSEFYLVSLKTMKTIGIGQVDKLTKIKLGNLLAEKALILPFISEEEFLKYLKISHKGPIYLNNNIRKIDFHVKEMFDVPGEN